MPMRKLAAAAGLAVALAATAAVAGPIEDLDGYWSGGGTVVFSEGAERVKCAVRYKVGQGGTQIRQTLRCASADYSINATAELSVRGAQVDGTLGGEDLLGHRPDIRPLHRQQLRPVDQGREFHGGDDRRPLQLQAVDHHPPQGPRGAPHLHEPGQVLAVAAAPRRVSRFVATPLIPQEKFGTILDGLGDGPWNDPRCEAGAPIDGPSKVSQRSTAQRGRAGPARNPGTSGSAPSEDRSGSPDRFFRCQDLLSSSAQNCCEVSTGTISKSARSSQRLAQTCSKAASCASMIWKQRRPAGLHPARVIDDAVGQHAALALEALADGLGVAIFEAFDHHEEHGAACTAHHLCNRDGGPNVHRA